MNRKVKHKVLCGIFFAVYLVLLLYFLFFAESFGRTNIPERYQYNLMPFHEINRYLLNYEVLGWKLVFLNLIGNVLAFVPLGFLVPVFFDPKPRFLRMFAVSVLLSFGVELIQLVFQVGSFDVDDILLNTLGSMIGYGIYRVARVYYRASLDHDL